MPRSELVLQIFAASPGDVAQERQALDHVIAELNSTWSHSLGVRLELIRWETHAYPAFGDDAQDVINHQLPQEYDLFLGIMWARYGTPTGRSDSGTAEEFELALARFRADRTSSQLMVYFKEAPLSIREIDAEQLAKVQEFRERVEMEGGLHWSFTDSSEFEGLVRLHLSRFVQQWKTSTSSSQMLAPGSGTAGAPSMIAQPDQSMPVALDSEEGGLIDLFEIAMDGVDVLTQVAARITEAMQELAANIELRTQELNSAKHRDGSVDLKAVKRATNRAADDMNQFVKRTRVEIPTFSRSYEDVIKATGQAASLSLDFPDREEVANGLATLAGNLGDLREVFTSTSAATRQLRDTVSATPRITTSYNRAKRLTIEVLDSLAREFDSAASLATQAKQTVRSLLPKDPAGYA